MSRIIGIGLLAITTAFGFLTLFIILSLILSIPTWLLWNWLMPEIFGLKVISLFQAWGLAFLSSILFKSSASNTKE